MARSPLSARLKILVDRSLSPEAISAVLAKRARAAVAELIADGRGSETYETVVDGQLGRSEDAVRPDGVIVYRFQWVGEAAAAAVAFLIDRSPEKDGDYKASFMISVNARSVRAEGFDPKRVPGDAEIVIYNTQPYSRLVDSQMAGNRPVKYSTEPHLFDDAMRAMRRQYRGLEVHSIYSATFPEQYRLPSGKRVASPALVIRRNKDR